MLLKNSTLIKYYLVSITLNFHQIISTFMMVRIDVKKIDITYFFIINYLRLIGLVNWTFENKE